MYCLSISFKLQSIEKQNTQHFAEELLNLCMNIIIHTSLLLLFIELNFQLCKEKSKQIVCVHNLEKLSSKQFSLKSEKNCVFFSNRFSTHNNNLLA